MKKRLLSILLMCCMVLTLLPTTAFAADTGKAIQLGTDALSKNVNTASAPTVYFGQNQVNMPAAWRVIGYDGNGVASVQEDMTLLAAGSMGEAVFDNDCSSIEYAPSDLKTVIDALAGKLTTKENAAVKKRTLTSGSHNGENTDCVAGGQVDNAVFWPLSSKEAIAVNEDLRVVDPEHPAWATSNWWLRSPGSQAYHIAVVDPDGSVHYSGYTVRIYRTRGVRPAFNLNLNSVLFASAAVGGKPDGGLTPIFEYTGNEWKLTLKDSNRNFAVTETTVSGDPGDTFTLHYTGATAGINEYISVILADNNGAQYYGRVAQPTAESGTVEIKIPSDIAPGDYTLKVFNEQYNGDYNTDYASNFTDIALTVENQPDEQFTLAPGGRYYFDLSAMNIPGTVNTGNIVGATSLPDTTLHYVPFTYAGTIEAYKLTSAKATTEEYAQQNKYAHSLFVADYAVTHTISWGGLNDEGLIFGKNYASGGVDYTLRAPSVGSARTGSSEPYRGTPQSNEWDRMLDKDEGHIKNWSNMYSWGQDASNSQSGTVAVCGNSSARYRNVITATNSYSILGFRPVLEVMNPDTLGSGGLKAVTLDLGGGKLGGSSDAIHIIVKTGSKFTAPASDGMTRPDGNTGSYFMWLGSNGKLYAPGASVPADVTELTVQWTAPTYAVTLNTNGGTINNGNVTEYTYGVGAALPAADDMTYTGHTFKGWYDNEGLTGSPVTAIGSTETGDKEYWAKWEINQYTITYDLAGGTVEGNPDTYTVEMDTFTLKNPTRPGYTFTGWSGTGLDGENNMTVTIPKGSTGERRYTAHWRYNGGSSGGSSSYPITVPSKTENGSVTVSPKNASAGSTVTITVKPDSGYVLETISVTDKNGNDLKLTDKGNGKYTFTMPTSKVEIKVTFMEDNSVLNFFYDVPNDAYYYEAVKWAAENGITGGVGSSLFAPNQPCTRAQIVTFLWRAAGSPVVNYLMPFTDVDEGAYYAEAVRWAASCGIVTGLTETTFGTDSVCTRAQAAAMIYRCAQAQGKGFTGAWMFHLPFTDVPEWAYESVAWCYMNGVTTGVSETSFAPGNDCTRAQIVTFLWRCKK